MNKRHKTKKAPVAGIGTPDDKKQAKLIPQNNCLECGGEMEQRSNKKFCSNPCRWRAWNKRHPRVK